MNFFYSFIALSSQIDTEPGIIVGPIAKVLGFILNAIFEFVSMITTSHSLGISIILFTIIARFLLVPLALKQQKSMVVMRSLQPKLKKIQDKYKDSATDPEAKRKMNMEIQKLYSDNKANPLSGCLPMLIQFPIFFALYYIMNNPYQFIDIINGVYTDIASNIIQTAGTDGLMKIGQEIVVNMVPSDMNLDLAVVSDFVKVVNKLQVSDFEYIINNNFASGAINSLLETKDSINYFLGINLTETAGFGLPNVMIPLISGLTTYLSSWNMTRKNKVTDPAMKTQQKVMNITMPLFMAYITSQMPCGVGLYWIVSNLFQMAQYEVLNRYYENKMGLRKEGVQ